MCVDGNAETTLTSFARTLLKCSRSNMSPNSLQAKQSNDTDIKRDTDTCDKLRK